MNRAKELRSIDITIYSPADARILALGDILSVGDKFAMFLHDLREQQRGKTWWLPSILNYNSSPTFIDDLLNACPAGAKVLGLIAATTGFSDDEFDALLTILYNKLNIPSHSSPSRIQRRQIRSLCMPLVDRLGFEDGFEDALMRKEDWILAKFKPHAVPKRKRAPTPSDAVPCPSTLAEVLIALKTVTRELEGYEIEKTTLVYHGFVGAPWVIAYCTYILDLPVCVIDQDENPHYMSPSSESVFQRYPVVLFPAALGPPKDLLHVRGLACHAVFIGNPAPSNVARGNRRLRYRSAG